MVLAMMDEVITTHESLRSEEMQAYCHLLQGKQRREGQGKEEDGGGEWVYHQYSHVRCPIYSLYM
jgi:hypothetical protein